MCVVTFFTPPLPSSSSFLLKQFSLFSIMHRQRRSSSLFFHPGARFTVTILRPSCATTRVCKPERLYEFSPAPPSRACSSPGFCHKTRAATARKGSYAAHPNAYLCIHLFEKFASNGLPFATAFIRCVRV